MILLLLVPSSQYAVNPDSRSTTIDSRCPCPYTAGQSLSTSTHPVCGSGVSLCQRTASVDNAHGVAAMGVFGFTIVEGGTS